MKSFWTDLQRPFFILAPMEDVTDTVFRQIVGEIAAPDVYVTEFTNCDGIMSAGRDVVIQRLMYTPSERPIVAQVWGIHPDNFYEAAKIIVAKGFDGIDINFGCPEKSVVSHGACAAMIDTPELARAIIHATRRGIQDSGKVIPISVKTRIGYKNISKDWIPFLLEQHLDALIVHGRTAAEMSKVPAHWDEIGKVVALRDSMRIPTPIIGNGDVKDRADGLAKARDYGVDGVMIGRGIFDNLWAFDRSRKKHTPTPHELFSIMNRHVHLFEETWSDKKNFAILKKFFKIYTKGFEGASDMRVRLMETNSYHEVKVIINDLLSNPIKT